MVFRLRLHATSLSSSLSFSFSYLPFWRLLFILLSYTLTTSFGGRYFPPPCAHGAWLSTPVTRPCSPPLAGRSNVSHVFHVVRSIQDGTSPCLCHLPFRFPRGPHRPRLFLFLLLSFSFSLLSHRVVVCRYVVTFVVHFCHFVTFAVSLVIPTLSLSCPLSHSWWRYAFLSPAALRAALKGEKKEEKTA